MKRFTVTLRTSFEGCPDEELVKDVFHRLLVNANTYLTSNGCDARVERVTPGVSITTTNLNDIAFPK